MGALTLGKESQTYSRGESPLEGVQTQHKTGSVVLVPDSGPARKASPVLGMEKRQSKPGAEIDHLKVSRTSAVSRSLLVPSGLCKSHFCLSPLSDGSFTSSRSNQDLPVADVHRGAELHRH